MANKAFVVYWEDPSGRFFFQRRASGKITDHCRDEGYSGPSTTNVRKAIQRRWPNIEMRYVGRA